MIIHGNSLYELKKIAKDSIDAIVTDPPYELGFMGKSWDKTGIANNVEMWAECLRVLKPGGHLLSFGGTRTYHRMAVAIEDAGFEVRDMIEWVYGSGFPKSLNVGKQVNKLETDEWSKISKAIDNIDQQSIMEVWKRNALFATIKLSKKIIEVGINTPKSDFAQDNAVLYFNVLNKQLNAIFAELQSKGLNLISEKHEIIAQENVEQSIIPSQNLVRYAVRLSNDQEAKHLRIFTAQCDVKEWLNENKVVNHKADEVLKTLRGNKKYSSEEITSVLCAVITNALKLTILSQSNTFQNLDTKSQMECASAISATITEYTAENLISNTVAILKSKAVDKLQGNEREVVGEKVLGGIKRARPDNAEGFSNPYTSGQTIGIDTKGTSEWEGWGTALKPSHEPICMARKPLAEKTVAENCLKWGTGGINIDESRVEAYDGNTTARKRAEVKDTSAPCGNGSELGRFPANLIHDNSEEVRECFPEAKGWSSQKHNNFNPYGGNALNKSETTRDGFHEGFNDSGNASRFFKSIIYQAKASKSERNKGCEDMDNNKPMYESHRPNYENTKGIETPFAGTGRTGNLNQNNHPTVKPIALMEYLIRMVTPKGGTVLDPFMGSGSTGVAAKNLGIDFVGIELEEDYIEIAKKRII